MAYVYNGSGLACRYWIRNRSPPSAITPFTMRPSSSCTQNHHGFLMSIKGILTTQTVTGHRARHNPLFTCPFSASDQPLAARTRRSRHAHIVDCSSLRGESPGLNGTAVCRPARAVVWHPWTGLSGQFTGSRLGILILLLFLQFHPIQLD